MSDISFSTQVPVDPSCLQQPVPGADDVKKAAEVVSELLSGTGVTVKVREVPGEGETIEGAPALDEPNYELIVDVDLEGLVAFLRMDNEKTQIEELKKRIESLKDQCKKRHTDRLEKMDKSFKEMDKAKKMSIFAKIFGWIMTGLAVLGAVLACVATGGLAVGAVVGAGIALTLQILNETGVMEKATNAFAEALEKAGCSKLAARILASVLITVASIAVSVGGGALAGKIANSIIKNALDNGLKTLLRNAASEIVNATANSLAQMTKVALIALGIITIGHTVGTAIQGYESGKEQSELTLLQKVLAALQRMLEEEEDDLKEIMQQLESGYAELIKFLESKTQSSIDIANEISNEIMG